MNYETRVSPMDATDPDLLGGDRSKRSPRWGLWLGVALAIGAVLAGAYYFMNRSDPAAAGAAPAGGAAAASQAPTVTVITPGLTQVERTITATGTLAARREMPVGVAGEGGQVSRVLVEPGSWVKAGQVLAIIDRSVQAQQLAALEAQVRVAQADANLTQAELARANQLVERGFVSRADIERRTAQRDAAAARVRVAQAQSSEARARTGRLDIRAPANGLVLTRQVEPGQVVSGGSGVLFRLASGGEMELHARVSEADLAALGVGARAVVTPVGGSRSHSGQVWQVAPVIDPQSRQGTARIALGYASDLRPGGFAEARLTAGSAPAPLLPQSAIQSDDKGSYVYIVGPDNVVARRDIEIGSVSDSGIAVASGLTGSERVVQSAGPFLAPGQKIRPVKPKG